MTAQILNQPTAAQQDAIGFGYLFTDIPEGQTVAEYRRRRPNRRKHWPIVPRLLRERERVAA